MTSLEFLQIDLPALAAAVFAALACALVGSFLVLRRQSLMGDAISHAVLPGIVIGFILSGSRASLPILAGALAAALVAGFLIEAVRRLGRLETGAAMGVVFTVLFALGVVLIEQAAARSVDLDADCVLYGQLEDVLWLAPTGWASLADPAVWADLPHEVTTLAVVAALVVAVVVLFYKELKIAAFDPALATTLGIPAALIHFGLIGLTAVVCIAAFEAVGSILVVALLVCPAAAARMLTDRLPMQLVLSAAFGILAAIAGYWLAAFGPIWLGGTESLNAAGMIAVMTGVLLVLAVLLGPRHGLLGRALSRRRLLSPAASVPAP